MKKIILLTLLTVCAVLTFAQDKIADELKALADNKDFDKIVTQYASRSADLSARSLYFVGLAYYMKEDDANCLKYINLSIEKDPKDPQPHYIKASTLNYMQRFDEAVKGFQLAIELKPDNPVYYSALGDSYYNLKNYELALASYKKSTEQKGPPDRPFSMIAQVYSDLNDKEKALEAYYAAKSKIAKGSDSYTNVLFNIGLLESLKGDYDKAEPAFIELIQTDSTDFHSYAKLVQVYYHRKEYEKAGLYKKKLYEAYHKNQLNDNLKDMFCFDQFKWNDKLVQAFERFEEGPKSTIYYKHLFYIVNEKNEIELRIQTEYSPVSVEHGGAKYLLCLSKGNTHATFNIGFNDHFNYDDLKKSVIDILEDKVKPVASSTPTKK